MRLLLDTRALLWWLQDDGRMGSRVRRAIETPANEITVSVVSLWEMVVKIRIGKLEADLREILRAIDRQDFRLLDISPAHLFRLARLPAFHRDPFGHLLVAQAIEEELVLVTADQRLAAYPVTLLRWSDAPGG